MFAQLVTLALGASLASAALIHDIQVGGVGQLTFSPSNIQADPGDILNFVFQQVNHTATQSSFANPCVKLKDTNGNPIGFDSGFMPVAATQSADFPSYQVMVNDTKPIWVYCRQSGHCGKGMVFSANAPATGNTFDAFQAMAVQQNGTAGAAAPTSPASVVTVTSTATPTDTPPTGTGMQTVYGSAPTPGLLGSTDHRVVVGGTAGLVYTPNQVTAAIGDTITFEFHASNHTATQSSFADPCRKLALTSTTGQVGFDSDFQPVTADATEFPTYTITVNSTTPIWVYCRQATHCGKGMVFAVNAPTTGNTYNNFVANALNLNGTGTSGSSAQPTQSGSGAGRQAEGAGLALLLLAGAVSLLL
ncbi:hypothetical protein CALCODRAFT_464142 [Calocera cornea HHB12733]|uniref:Cupredoxin n=1 Tax=Calocera cornea HHB12733 TaxID=1353952 RepID=A0A165J5B9_9BASI|nr:hypothetical protein CALCODRAFT_464142 [Calocera cornea HHB12733]